ncbi:MAG TPA: 2'-5' RNA ligase family protein [Gemmatimonadaceae bacterium]|nr:2'-5' RNA ligase family protein [Gemmatimonadaceae bacterium]
MNNGIFVVHELTGALRERVRAIHRQFDPRLANSTPPHVTLVGSSGVGPIPLGTSPDRIVEALEPVVRSFPPIVVHFGPAVRFMQTQIVVLPLSPHGQLRTLHERIATSGLPFERSRFPFSPHCTLSFFPTLTPERARSLLAIRISEPVVVDRLQFFSTVHPQAPRRILELRLTGGDPAASEPSSNGASSHNGALHDGSAREDSARENSSRTSTLREGSSHDGESSRDGSRDDSTGSGARGDGASVRGASRDRSADT